MRPRQQGRPRRPRRRPITAALPLLAVALGVGLAAAAEPAPAGADSAAIDAAGAWRAVDAAREAAGQDRHQKAAHRFLEALNRDARLVPTVADELAYQKLWREDAEKAIFYFRRYLARHPDRENRDVRRGLALALSWSGRQDQAVALYRELLAKDADDHAARLGLGRALIWDNRLAAGAAVLRDLAADPRATGAARRGADDFLLTVLDGYDPHLDLRWRASWDSDDLDIQRAQARGRTNLGSVLLEAGVRRSWYAQPGQPDATGDRLRLGAVVPLARNWTLHAYGWLDRFTSDGPVTFTAADLDWTRPGGDAWLTWIATARLRLDLGAASQKLETYQALAEEIHHDLANLSAEWRLARRWTLSASGQLADFSDGNARRRATAGLHWRREGRWGWRVGPVASFMDYDDPYPGGYWAPDWVRNARLQVVLQRRWPRLLARLDGSLGREKEPGAEAITVGGISGHLGWRLGERWLLQLDVGYTRSRFTTASGYSRTAAGVGLRGLF
jgi:hypothetical protein